MARRAIIIGVARDFDGCAWDVREARPTKHGFDLLIGWPEGCRGPGYGAPRVIPTRELDEYFDSIRLRRDGAIYDLPVCRTTVQRIRRILGFDYYLENSEWWLERLDDLTTMSNVHFAAVHGVGESTVSVVRSKLLGRRIREANWWREESNAELLAGNLPRAYVADRLGISIGTVGRLRWLVRKENAGSPEGRPIAP